MFNVTNLPHQRGQSPKDGKRLLPLAFVTLPAIAWRDQPVEAVDEPLADGAEVSDVGYHCAVCRVGLQVHREGEWCCNI